MAAGLRTGRLFVAGAGLIVATCAACTWLVSNVYDRLVVDEQRASQLAQARTLAALVSQYWETPDDALVRRTLDTLRASGAEVVIADAAGEIRIDARADGRREPPVIPELRSALRGGSTADVRVWTPGLPPQLVASARVEREGAGVGVVWLARPAATVSTDSNALGRVALATSVLAAVATLAFVAIAARIRAGAAQRVIDAARSMSEGDFLAPPPDGAPDDVAALAGALQAPRERLAAQIALIDRQRRMLESLVDQLREGVVVARGDGRVALINPAAVRMLGLELAPGEADSLVGRSVEASIPQHTLQRLLSGPLLPAERQQADEARDPDSRAVSIEVQTRRGAIHLLARASDVVLAEPGEMVSGGALGRVVVLTDITTLQRTIQMRTDFVANASHELRTPLSTIRAAIETLLSMDLSAEGPAARQFLSKIDRQSLRLEQLVSDLLDLSRLESPTARFTPEPIDCRRVVNELHGRFADALGRKSLEWVTRIEPEGARVIVVNPQLLRLVLDNLVDNAIKFTEPGGRVSVTLRCGAGESELVVSDTGCGIPEDEQQRVFERFYQVQRARAGGADRGTGLGLSIVRHAVGAMGATIRLQSAPGAGTTVTITIPQPSAVRD